MKILGIELSGYKRFKANHILYLKIDFKEKIQLILGTNGSGKSSLMQELSPLPANSADFKKDGFKRITVEHNKAVYVLTSDFKIQKHQFIKDGEELNSGGTLTVQRDLVKKEFGITPELHDLMIGNVRFHRMTPAQRKYWFTLFSQSDYTFALEVYQRLKDKLKDNQGALKIVQNRLLQEQSKILDPEKEKEIREFIEFLKNLLRELRQKQLSLKGSPFTQSQFEALNQEIIQFSKRLIKTTQEFYLKYRAPMTISEISAALLEEENNGIKLQSMIDLREKDLQQYQHVLSQIEKNSQFNVMELIGQNKQMQVQIEQSLARTPFFEQLSAQTAQLNIAAIEQQVSLLSEIELSALEIAAEIKPDPNRLYTKEAFERLREQLASTKLRLQNNERELSLSLKTLEQMEHARSHNETQCPKCQFVWIRDFDEKTLAKTLQAKEAAILQQSTLIKQIEDLEKRRTEMEQFFQYHLQFYRLMQSTPTLQPVWSILVEEKLLFENPGQLGTFFQRFRREFSSVKDILQLKDQLAQNKAVIEEIQKNKNNNLEETRKKAQVLESQITKYVQASRESRAKALLYKQLMDLWQDSLALSQTTETLLDQKQERIEGWSQTQLKTYYQELIDIVEAKIEHETVQINQIDRIKHSIELFKEQASELQDQIAALKILSTELSPSQGLIARGMSGFIDLFIKEINLTLSRIWLYPLELVLSNLKEDEGAELDYKFELKVNDEQEPIKDISKGSSAMKEVIDLAFRIVCMKYLGILDYPLFLDEFGHTMDSAHRFEATKLVHELGIYGHFSQIFLISHFENSYGTFKNAQANVLCANNIVIPKEMQYNQNAILQF